MTDAIRFYFDFISPYAWIAWTRIGAIAEAHGRALAPIPVLFAALLDAHGQLGPAEIPAKRRYVMRDAWRKARRLGLDIHPPPAHPFNPLTALRAVSLLDGEPQRRALDACFAAVWGGGGGLADAEAVARALSGAGFDGPALVARTRAPAIKAQLRAATAEAIAAGVFGVPTAIIDGELFWGTDSLDDIADHLAGRPGPPPELDRLWSSLPSAATRPGSKGRGGDP